MNVTIDMADHSLDTWPGSTASHTLARNRPVQPPIQGNRYFSRKLLNKRTAPASRISSVDISARNAGWIVRSISLNQGVCNKCWGTLVYHKMPVFQAVFYVLPRCISGHSAVQ